MRQSTKDAIERIKKAGFSYIKVELEGDIGRGSNESCYECDEGQSNCYNCDGEGAVESSELVGVSWRDNWVECEDCVGEGVTTCSECDGSGEAGGSFASEDRCYDYMRSLVSNNARDKLIYGNFYEDGSVDSEFTFTVHIDDSETIIEWIEAFNSLARECGHMDVDGAGMHISVLPTECNGSYPCYGDLDWDGMNNFSTQMNRLMPALFFLSTPDWRSRPLEYRFPRVSDEDKFSAIYTHSNTCLEYRVFETCYDKPEKMFDNIEVIANSLEFYANPKLEATKLNRDFSFYEQGSIGNIFDTPDALRVLNKQIKLLKPKNTTIKQLKKDRNIAETIKEVTLRHKARINELRADYERLKEVNDRKMNVPLTDNQRHRVDELVAYQGYTRLDAERRVRDIRLMPQMRDFIKDNIKGSASYTVSV